MTGIHPLGRQSFYLALYVECNAKRYIRIFAEVGSMEFGIADYKYYDRDLIKCRDGSKSFPRDRLNDNFCDCPDGTDEPGTSACPLGKFYCRNAGSTPKFLFSSRINDNICDCCDGSDEYGGTVVCPYTCVRGGNTGYHSINYVWFRRFWKFKKN